MLVGQEWIAGTVGGGQLERAAIEAARSLLLDSRSPSVQLHKLVLATELAQCCGGVVELWIERYSRADLQTLELAVRSMRRGPTVLVSTLDGPSVTRRIMHGTAAQTVRELDHSDRHACLIPKNEDLVSLWERLDRAMPSVYLYGAGHVGQALIRILERLPMRVRWIDSRAELLPEDVVESVEIVRAAEPAETVPLAPPATHFIIMTHSHPLDYALCRAVLKRSDFAWAGVIGSKSKGARFRSRLARDDVPTAQIARLACPIGIDGIDSRLPAAIAVAVAAQLLQHSSRAADIAVSSASRMAADGSSAGQQHEVCRGCSLTCGTP
jgi:xanthine dehydrogenase accessory factor